MIMAPISAGELVDKITILQIKYKRFQQPNKERVKRELRALLQILRHSKLCYPKPLRVNLSLVNQELWDAEEAIRHATNHSHSSELIAQLAIKIHQLNDQRARIKLEINKLTGSYLVELKSYILN